jgi:hypothetical protein
MRIHDMTSNTAHRNCARDRHVVAVTARVIHVFDACTLEPLYAMHSQRSVSLRAMQHRTWDRWAAPDPEPVSAQDHHAHRTEAGPVPVALGSRWIAYADTTPAAPDLHPADQTPASAAKGTVRLSLSPSLPLSLSPSLPLSLSPSLPLSLSPSLPLSRQAPREAQIRDS